MYMKVRLLHAYWLLTVLLVASCAREVFIELPDEGQTRLVLVSHFTDHQPIRVRVSLSQPVYEGTPPVNPTNVDVTVARRGIFLDKLFRVNVPGGDFYWQSRDTLLFGEPYSVSARIAGLPVAEGSSTIPWPEPIFPIIVESSQIRTDNLNNGQQALRVPIRIRLKEPPGNQPYFAFQLREETEVYDTSFSPPVLDETRENDCFFLADGRTLSLLHDIPEPVILVNEKFWDEGNQTLELTAYIPFVPEKERPKRIFVEWRTLTEEFYRYHLSIARQGNNNTPLADPDAVFNNIKNGYGNVSAYAVQMDTVIIPD